MGWGVIPVLEFYGITPSICPQIISSPIRRFSRRRQTSLTCFHPRQPADRERQGRIESFLQGIFKSDDVLVALGASLELEAPVDTKILIIDLHVSMIPAVAAGQPF